jgi:hypothetical protein
MTIELTASDNCESITLRATGQMERVHVLAALVRLERAMAKQPAAYLVIDARASRTLQSDSLWFETIAELFDTCRSGTRVAYLKSPDWPERRAPRTRRIARASGCWFDAFSTLGDAEEWASKDLEYQ